MKGDPGHSGHDWQAAIVLIGLALGSCLLLLTAIADLLALAWKAVTR